MEPNIRHYFVVIVNTISILIIWMMLQILFGLYLRYAFFAESPTWKNWLYYALSLASFIWLVRHIIKKWTALSDGK